MAGVTPIATPGGPWLGTDPPLERDLGAPPPPPDPTENVVIVPIPPSHLDDVAWESYGHFHRRQPLHKLRAMMTTPPGQSAFWALHSTVLSGGFQLAPAVRGSDDAEPDPDLERSRTILEQCRRAADALPVPLEVWAWEMLDAVGERVKLAEMVLEVIAEGPDRGLYGLAIPRVKPRWSWRFGVDDVMDVVSIRAYTDDREWDRLDPRHFVWMAWDATEGDPRGNSCLDAAYHAFNVLCQLWPEALAGWKQFGFPNILLSTGEHDRRDVPIRDAQGNPTGRTESAETRLARQGALMKSGAIIAGTFGTQGKVLESVRDGAMVENAIRMLESAIIVCVLLQTRSIREAEFGSRADAEVGTGVVGTFAQVIRHWLCAAARRPFEYLVEANYDRDIARRLTPRISLGKIDPRNFAAVAQAIAVLYQSGYFTESQLLWIDEYIGIPIRLEGEDRVGPQKDNAGSAAPTPARGSDMAALLGQIEALLVEKGMPARAA